MVTIDWLAIALAGAGAIMATLGKKVVRVIGGAMVVVALIGWFASRSNQIAEAQNPPAPSMGSNNTIINVPPPTSMGSGNTIIGPTDSHGNTIINQGGTAIGSDACADSTGIAIGAGAKAGCPPQRPVSGKAGCPDGSCN